MSERMLCEDCERDGEVYCLCPDATVRPPADPFRKRPCPRCGFATYLDVHVCAGVETAAAAADVGTGRASGPVGSAARSAGAERHATDENVQEAGVADPSVAVHASRTPHVSGCRQCGHDHGHRNYCTENVGPSEPCGCDEPQTREGGWRGRTGDAGSARHPRNSCAVDNPVPSRSVMTTDTPSPLSERTK